MALLDIHVLGSPILRQETQPVAEVTDALRRLADDMLETMHAAKGIGLAAPQVGRAEKLFVAEVEEVKLVLFNPEIVLAEGNARGEEGCLSIPDIYGDVDRPSRVVMRGLDREGRPVEVEGTELLGRCMQHELDHLNGKLFLDHLGMFKRRSALQKWEREKAKYPALRRGFISAKDVAAQHNDEAL
ncbi:peptide deformylase [Roseisolibacter sp. H3M3-2]|uniref:peptide deformylase n=1 Tax=Roseisolibacter sp. H3M3-2 TaxID=3031323 RepID=UPI0023D980EC|nr:peptide deformylase [Roseisolibacter sp. H3M3-2]MDF1504240.1 peptide deformylase [Roseisolibacter sp. H3M3-2]